MNVPLYKALTSAGAAEALATEAAKTVPSDPATKADVAAVKTEVKAEVKIAVAELRAEVQVSLANLRAWLMWRMLIAMGAQVGLFVALIKLFN